MRAYSQCQRACLHRGSPRSNNIAESTTPEEVIKWSIILTGALLELTPPDTTKTLVTRRTRRGKSYQIVAKFPLRHLQNHPIRNDSEQHLFFRVKNGALDDGIIELVVIGGVIHSNVEMSLCTLETY